MYKRQEEESAVRQSRFFVIFGLLQAWSIAAGFVIGVGFGPASAIDAVALVTCLVLAASKSRTVHYAGLAIIWLGYIASAVLDTVG